MNIITLTLGDIATNCYIVYTKNNNAIVIDPGDECAEIISSLNRNNLKLKKILLTHGHFDHILAVKELSEKTGAEVFVHKDDEECLYDKKKSLYSELCMNRRFAEYKGAFKLDDGDKITLDELEFRLIHTPGHSEGSCCYIDEKNKVIFSGDTLFYCSVGKTFSHGNYSILINSLKKLTSLKDNYKIYPGHGPSTTLDFEKEHNIYLADFNQI